MRLFAIVVLAIVALSSAAAEVRAKAVGGVVSDASGAVVGNADVTLILYDSKNHEVSRMSTRTNEIGQYSFQNVESAKVALFVSSGNAKPRKQTFTTKRNTGDILAINITIE
jgi:hypothetical protein